MLEERIKTNVRERPVAPLLPKDFVDRAPTDRGPDALIDWLDNRNLYNAIEQEVEARLDYLPPLETLGPLVKDHIEHALEDRIKTVTQLLWRYADVRHQTITYHDPEKAHWRKKSRERIPVTLQEKLVKPGRVERLKERQLLLEQLISDLGLDTEKAVIDHLFEETSAVPGIVGQVAKKGLLAHPS